MRVPPLLDSVVLDILLAGTINVLTVLYCIVYCGVILGMWICLPPGVLGIQELLQVTIGDA